MADDFETFSPACHPALARRPRTLLPVRALIAADIFADILEMAEYLLSEGYKDAAAVLIGAALEGHLRHLGNRHIVAITHADGRPFTAWLDLRNSAAHGHYDVYTADYVRLFLQGVRLFMTQVPA